MFFLKSEKNVKYVFSNTGCHFLALPVGYRDISLPMLNGCLRRRASQSKRLGQANISLIRASHAGVGSA